MQSPQITEQRPPAEQCPINVPTTDPFFCRNCIFSLTCPKRRDLLTEHPKRPKKDGSTTQNPARLLGGGGRIRVGQPPAVIPAGCWIPSLPLREANGSPPRGGVRLFDPPLGSTSWDLNEVSWGSSLLNWRPTGAGGQDTALRPIPRSTRATLDHWGSIGRGVRAVQNPKRR